jgi:hypothetical protein
MNRYVLLIFVFTGTIAVSYLTETRTGFSTIGIDSQPVRTHWRRTAGGWESVDTWRTTPRSSWSIAGIHPITIAAFQLLASIGALVAFERGSNESRDRWESSRRESRTRLGISNSESGIQTSLVQRRAS